MFSREELRVFKRIDSVSELFVVLKGEDIYFYLFTFLISGSVIVTQAVWMMLTEDKDHCIIALG